MRVCAFVTVWHFRVEYAVCWLEENRARTLRRLLFRTCHARARTRPYDRHQHDHYKCCCCCCLSGFGLFGCLPGSLIPERERALNISSSTHEMRQPLAVFCGARDEAVTQISLSRTTPPNNGIDDDNVVIHTHRLRPVTGSAKTYSVECSAALTIDRQFALCVT